MLQIVFIFQIAKVEGYPNKIIPIEYPIVEKERYHIYFKGLIKVTVASKININLISLWILMS